MTTGWMIWIIDPSAGSSPDQYLYERKSPGHTLGVFCFWRAAAHEPGPGIPCGVTSGLWQLAERVCGALAEPRRLLRFAVRMNRRAPFELRLKYDVMPRPSFAYGVYHAAVQARALDIDRMTAIELGVGPGEGLIALERIADEVHAATGVAVNVLGLDTGKGMPPPEDHRDLPYRWAEGEFAMDPGALRARLKRAELILGNVRDTIAGVLARPGLAPIGFVSFDLDYYSSTRDALVMFDASPRVLLPRIFCHVDDVIGDDWELHCEHVGELLAIREFNESRTDRKLSPVHGLAHKRMLKSWWNDTLHVLHVFDHPLYNHLLPDWSFHHEEADRRLAALREAQAAERRAWLAGSEGRA